MLGTQPRVLLGQACALPLSYKLPAALPCLGTGSPVARLVSTGQTVEDDGELPIPLFQLSRCQVQDVPSCWLFIKLFIFVVLRIELVELFCESGCWGLNPGPPYTPG